ncbi:T9SS type A sorting domain-containing protein [Puia sp. P3]|uniref:T9SS type A sorting domain-containing protein n=1 Tax=Puia sp. P3 TaxID=3423952 RepID=UPI003D67CDC3
MKFSLQYLYCKAGGTLATSLTRWTARLQQPRTVQLDWSAVNETAGRVYHVQRSTDGRSFSDIAIIPARNDNNPDYSLSDVLPGGPSGSSTGSPTAGSSGSFYYRLLIDDQGSISYSTIQQVRIDADAQGIRVYPNPATDFISVSTGATGNWRVDILAADGSLVQRETFLQASTMRVNFRSRMSAGTYFVRAFDLRGQRNFTSSFIVTGH